MVELDESSGASRSGSWKKCMGNIYQGVYDKFILKYVKDQWKRDFQNLVQGDMSHQYEQQFTRLAKYAPTLVGQEVEKIRHFLDGLSVDIYMMIDHFPT